jgi:phage major head subunit gpT-like protein
MNPITQAELDAMRITYSSIFQDVVGTTPTWHQELCTEVPSGGHGNLYGWAVGQLAMRQWIGPRMTQNITEKSFFVENLPFEATVELHKDRIEDDRNTIGVFGKTALTQLAAAAAKHPDVLLHARLTAASGVGVDAFDELPFFDDSHPNYNMTGSGATTYDNKYGLALSADNLNTVWSAMVGFIGENGLPMGVVPDTLFVAPQLKRVALEILSSTTYAQSGAQTNSIDNVMKGWLKPVIVPELATDPTRWYIADCSKPIKPFIFQKRSAPVMTSRDQLTDPKVFDQKILTYGVDYRGEIAPTFPFLMATSKP